MKKYLIILFSLLSVVGYGQVTPSKVVRVVDSTQVFVSALAHGSIIINTYDNRAYQILRSIAGTKKLSNCQLGVDYLELQTTPFDDQLRSLGSMAWADIHKFPQLNQYNVFTDSLAVPDLAFNSTTWNNSMGVVTRNAFRDEIIRYRLLSNHDSISTLDDVTITSIADGELFRWNGTKWINNTLAEAGIVNMTYPGAGIPLSTGTAWGTSITDNSANWNTAYSDRLKWDGGATGLVASTGRTSLGLGTAAQKDTVFFEPAIAADGNTKWWRSDKTWQTITASGLGGATKALDNLAAVAINTALLPGTAGNISIGSALYPWDDLFLGNTSLINFNSDVAIVHSLNKLEIDGGDLSLGVQNLLMTGSIASTGSRVTKGWFTDIDVTTPLYIGTTSIALNRTSGQQSLTGVSIDGNAGTVTVSDETTDTETYPLFSLSATGSLGVKSDATKLKYNSNTGTLTANAFVGTVSTSGSAAKWATARRLYGHWVDGSANMDSTIADTYISSALNWNNAYTDIGRSLGSAAMADISAFATAGHGHTDYLTSQISHADVLVDGDFTSEGIMLRGATAGTYSILTNNSANWNTAYGWGNHALAGYVTGTPWTGLGYATTTQLGAKLDTTNATYAMRLNWNTAYNWGNHASAGYTTGTGTAAYLPRWTAASTLGNSIIRDDGTNIGINAAPDAAAKVVISSTANTYAVYATNTLANATGLFGGSSAASGYKVGVTGSATNAGTNYGGFFTASGGTTNWGLYVENGNTRLNGTVQLAGIDYTFPATAGTSTYMLTTNGAGVLAWSVQPSFSMVYPGAGISVSTGTEWGTSITTSALLRANISDETGTTGGLVFAGSPSFVTKTNHPDNVHAYIGTGTTRGDIYHNGTDLLMLNTTGKLWISGTGTGNSVWLGYAGDTVTPYDYVSVRTMPTTNISKRVASTEFVRNAITAYAGGGSMVYPAAGIPLSVAGTSWGTSITTSAGLAGAISNETGTGALMFATVPTVTDSILIPKRAYDGTSWKNSGRAASEDAVRNKLEALILAAGSLTLGETSTTAYRGDRGKLAYDYSLVGHLPLAGGTLTGKLILATGSAGGVDFGGNQYIFSGANNNLYYRSNVHSILSGDGSTQWAEFSTTGITIPATKKYLSGTENIYNIAVQAVTTTWNIVSGNNATITIGANTTITLSNLVAGSNGNLTVTNPATAYTITFAGYTNKISPSVRSAANTVTCSGGSKLDVFSWYFDGSYLFWNGTKDYN